MAKKRTFKASVFATPQIADAYQAGVQALKREHVRNVDDKHCATGSIDLDKALAKVLPDAHRWDYGIGLHRGNSEENIVWLEVHHSASGETRQIERKKLALQGWLETESPHLLRLTKLRPIFVWQLSNSERNPSDRTRRNRDARKFGVIRVEGRLRLSEF